MLADGCLKREVVASMPTRYPSFPNPEIHVGYSFSACFLFVSARFGTIWKQLKAFWKNFEVFGSIMQAFWKHFGSMLEAFESILDIFGNILKSFGSM